MKCSIPDCTTDAVSHVRWGADVEKHANLCGHHIQIIWEEAAPQVKAGLCWWQQSPVMVFEEGK